jgi:hypothetical protein
VGTLKVAATLGSPNPAPRRWIDGE